MLRKLVLSGVAVMAIGAIAALPVPLFTPPREAKAAANVNLSIGIGTFYDRLDPYGDWIWYRGRYVWVPDRIGPRWRPYALGHWVYTRRHGWYWVSDEPFGWAAYHYGRWSYSPRIGWFWVPGRRWAPAWVVWHNTDRYVGWAPLPPRWDNRDWDDDDDFDMDASASFNVMPDVYWQVVPFSAFLSVNVSDHVIRDRERVYEVVRRGRPRVVHVENNIVVNNFIDIDVIEKKTEKKVVVHEAKAVSNPEAAGKTEGTTLAVFDPEVKDEPVRKPKKLKKLEEIEKKKEALKIEEPALDEEPPAASEEEQAKKKKKRAVGTADDEEQPDIEAVPTEEEPVKKKRKKTVETTEEGQQPAIGAVTTEEEPVKKKRKKAALQEGGETDARPEATTIEEQPPKRKKKKSVEENQQPVTTDEQPVKKKKKKLAEQQQSEQAPADEPKPAKKKKKETAECDPSAQECPTAD